MQTETVFFSRFPDNATPDAEALVPAPDVVLIHPKPALAELWRWDDGAKCYRKRVVACEATFADARAFVPAGAQKVSLPGRGFEAWECR